MSEYTFTKTERMYYAAINNVKGRFEMIKRIATPYSYSSAVEAGDYVFIGLHRGFGESFNEQINDTFQYLRNTLSELSLTLESVVKVNVYLKNIEDLPQMEKAFFEYYEEGKFPARMTSTTEFIDKDCLVMIEGIAYKHCS